MVPALSESKKREELGLDGIEAGAGGSKGGSPPDSPGPARRLWQRLQRRRSRSRSSSEERGALAEPDLEAGEGGMAGDAAAGQAAGEAELGAAANGGSVRGGSTARVHFAASVGEGPVQAEETAGPRRAATDGGAPAAMQVDRSVCGSKRNAAAFKSYIKPSPSVAGLAQASSCSLPRFCCALQPRRAGHGTVALQLGAFACSCCVTCQPSFPVAPHRATVE